MLSLYRPSKKRLRAFFDDDFDFFDDPFFFPEIEIYRPSKKLMKRFKNDHFDFKFNMEDTDDGKQLTCKLPEGFDSNNIKINLDTKKKLLDITLSDDKEWKSEDGCSYKKTKTEIKRSFTLDKDIDTKNVKSSITDNELVVNLPYKVKEKKEEKVVEIPVEILED